MEYAQELRYFQKTKLKVKIKSLAEEARIIRQEEYKVHPSSPQWVRSSIRSHRIIVVREEARSSLLAYAFIRGIPYSRIESKCDRIPNFLRIKQIARTFFHITDEDTGLVKWIEDAKECMKKNKKEIKKVESISDWTHRIYSNESRSPIPDSSMEYEI